jgi:uncharacterized repeat protein (TIGR04076 family)
MMYDVKITVMKKLFHKDLIDKYAKNPKKWDLCEKFKEGDEFSVSKDKPWEIPKYFCGWAWADIQKMVFGIARGGPTHFITCCTDGYRPVIFKIERIDK